MAEYAPAAIQWLYAEIAANAPKSWKVKLSGIVGDGAHTYGYHRSRNWIRANGNRSDYSIQLPYDKEGDGNAASALDISMSYEGMQTVTRRLIEAAESPTDDRPGALREFYGTLNGSTVDGRIHDAPTAGWSRSTSDSSHLWHVHLSFFRKWATDKSKLALIRDIILGRGADMDSGDTLNVGDYWAKEVFADDPGIADGKITVATALVGGYMYPRVTRDMLREQRAVQEAILAAVTGSDVVEAVRAALAEDKAAREAEHAALLQAIRDLVSAGATAQEIVDALAERLAS